MREPIKFLRAREIVHYQRFGEALRIATDRLNSKNFYEFNPSFDAKPRSMSAKEEGCKCGKMHK